MRSGLEFFSTCFLSEKNLEDVLCNLSCSFVAIGVVGSAGTPGISKTRKVDFCFVVLRTFSRTEDEEMDLFEANTAGRDALHGTRIECGAKQTFGPDPLDSMPWYSSLFAWFSSIFFTKSAEIAIIGLQASSKANVYRSSILLVYFMP